MAILPKEPSSCHWELIQVLAWVFLRDQELVERLADPGYRQQEYYWAEVILPDGRKTLAKQNAGPVNDVTLDVTAAYEELYEDKAKYFRNSKVACDAIIRELANKNLTAWGFENDRGNLIEIPQIQWTELTIHFNRHLVASPQNISSTASSWHGIKFQSADILRVWPPGIATKVPTMIDTVPDGFQSLTSIYQRIREATGLDARVRLYHEQENIGSGGGGANNERQKAFSDLSVEEDKLISEFREFLAIGKVKVWMRGLEEIPSDYWQNEFLGSLAIAHGKYQASSSSQYVGPKEEDPIRHRGKQLLFKAGDLGIVRKRFGLKGDQEGGADGHQPENSIYHSGFPGRGTSKHIIYRELERRVEAGECEPSGKKEAEVLAAWLKAEHPNAHPAKARTIENWFSSDGYFRKKTAHLRATD